MKRENLKLTEQWLKEFKKICFDECEIAEMENEFKLQKLYEGLIYTADIKTSLRILKTKYRYLAYSIGKNNLIELLINKKNVDQFLIDLNKILTLLNNLGWFPSKIIYFSDTMNKIKWDKKNIEQIPKLIEEFSFIKIIMEAKYDLEIDIPEKLYHISPDYYETKIKEQGLIPKTNNKLSTHPDRIYLLKSIEDAKILIKLIARHLKRKTNTFLIYEIDTMHLDKLFQDPNSSNGCYTLENIHPTNIKIIEIIKI